MSISSRTRRRATIAAVAVSGSMLVAAIGLRVGQDEARLVRTAGVSAPLEEMPAAPVADELETDAPPATTAETGSVAPTTTTSAPAAQPAAPTTTATGPAPAVTEPVADEPTTTTSTVPPAVVETGPTTTTTFYGPPWWCPVPAGRGQTMVPCDSTTTTTESAS